MFGLIWLQLYCVGRRTVGAIPQHLGGAKIWVALKTRDRNPCIWQSYLDGFCAKWATWWARVPPHPPHPPAIPHVSRTLMQTACFQRTPYARSYRKGTGENPDTSLGCEEGGCGTDTPSGKQRSVRLGDNVWAHPGCLGASSDDGKTPKSQWLILTWRLPETSFAAGWAAAPRHTCPLGSHTVRVPLAPWLPRKGAEVHGPGGSPAALLPASRFGAGQWRHRLCFFPGALIRVREEKRIKRERWGYWFAKDQCYSVPELG